MVKSILFAFFVIVVSISVCSGSDSKKVLAFMLPKNPNALSDLINILINSVELKSELKDDLDYKVSYYVACHISNLSQVHQLVGSNPNFIVISYGLNKSKHFDIFESDSWSAIGLMQDVYSNLLGVYDEVDLNALNLMVNELKKVNFDFMIHDYPNMLSNYFYSKLNIKRSIYILAECFTASYFFGQETADREQTDETIADLHFPGLSYNKKMQFFQRFTNSIVTNVSRVLLAVADKTHSAVFSAKFNKSEELNDSELIISQSLFLSSCEPAVEPNRKFLSNFIIAGQAPNNVSGQPSLFSNSDKLGDLYSQSLNNLQIILKKGGLTKEIVILCDLTIHQLHLTDSNTKERITSAISVSGKLLIFYSHIQTATLDQQQAISSMTYAAISNNRNLIFNLLADEIPTITIGINSKSADLSKFISDTNIGIGGLSIDKIKEYLENVRNSGILSSINELSQFINNQKTAGSHGLTLYQDWFYQTIKTGHSNLFEQNESKAKNNFFTIINYDVAATFTLILLGFAYVIRIILIWMFCSCSKNRQGGRRVKYN